MMDRPHKIALSAGELNIVLRALCREEEAQLWEKPRSADVSQLLARVRKLGPEPDDKLVACAEQSIGGVLARKRVNQDRRHAEFEHYVNAL